MPQGDDFIIASEQDQAAPSTQGGTPTTPAPVDVPETPAAPAPAADDTAPPAAPTAPATVEPAAPDATADTPQEQSRRRDAAFAALRRRTEQLELENSRLRQPPEPPPLDASGLPPYASEEERQRAMIRQETARALAQERAQEAWARQHQAFLAQEAAARQAHQDYDAAINSLDVPFAQPVLDAIKGDEVAAEITYYLATHRAEAESISRMPPAQGLMAIGRLAVQFQGAQPPTPTPPLTRQTPLPTPVSPVGSAGSAQSSADPSTMDHDTFSAWYVKQFGGRW